MTGMGGKYYRRKQNRSNRRGVCSSGGSAAEVVLVRGRSVVVLRRGVVLLDARLIHRHRAGIRMRVRRPILRHRPILSRPVHLRRSVDPGIHRRRPRVLLHDSSGRRTRRQIVLLRDGGSRGETGACYGKQGVAIHQGLLRRFVTGSYFLVVRFYASRGRSRVNYRQQNH